MLQSLILMTASALAQSHSCGTDQYYKMMLSRNPDLAKQEAAYNEEAAQMQKQPVSRATVYTIPVVFHIIHTNGPENISREQVLDQVRVLNQDFSYTNPNKVNIRSVFTGVAADCQIKFELANVAPDGSCTDGINRVYSALGGEVDQSDAKVKSLVRWDYKKYLNVWVVTSIKSTGNGTILGYAVFPFATNAQDDGIVIRHDRVGTIGTAVRSDSGRTLTHEIGHWLGLYHTFQGGCGDDDFCSDTPPVEGTFTNANCPANGNSCTEANDKPDQWENYMDYSEGRCMAMFTLQQKSRMHGYLGLSPRKEVVSASNLLATGVTLSTSTVPTASFSSSHTVVCAGQPVQFYDLSCKAQPTIWAWSLPGSSIPSSSSQNPVVIYQTPGKYNVSLTVQNNRGSSLAVTRTEYIEVIAKSNARYPNLEEGFEADPNGAGFRHQSPAGSRWELSNAASYTGSQCYKAPVSSADLSGKTYSFSTPAINLASLRPTTSRLTMYVAYAPSGLDESEVLRIYVSTDCGNTFRQIFERSGSALAYTGAPVTNNFVPTAKNQWRLTGIVSLPSLGLDTLTNAIFRVDVISRGGNPVYLDNINISQWYAGTDELSSGLERVVVYPNPSSGTCKLDFRVIRSGPVKIKLLDLQGRVVKQMLETNLNAGNHGFDLTRFTSDLSGAYLIRIETNEGAVTKPITFAP